MLAALAQGRCLIGLPGDLGKFLLILLPLLFGGELSEEGLFAGVSAGAIAYVANRIAGELDEGNVVFLVPDDGWKYLSSGVYTTPIDELEGIDSTVWW